MLQLHHLGVLGSNVESKTRCRRLADVAGRARRAGARFEASLHQVDVYFAVSEGRLKLREISHATPDGAVARSAELIRYRRPDTAGARVSTYERSDVADPVAVRSRLSSEHGVRGIVEKRRELWILDATRIHLDRVEGLGDFVELETVSRGEPGDAEREEHDRVGRALGLDPSAAVAGSYIDLFAAKHLTPRSG